MSYAQSSLYLASAVTLLLSVADKGRADNAALEAEVRKRSKAVEEKLIAWRRDIHQHPELGDQETRTAAIVAKHLRGLGLEVRTGVARTGVVGILKGGKPGRTVALRADMDALPVQEPAGLPFASKEMAEYHGKMVPIMHACGHDAHTAMLMATAEVLAGLKDDLPGTVVFIFQPAEEGSSLFAPSAGRSWGAKLMLEEGLFKKTKPDAVFALHVMPGRSGEILFRSGPTAASSDTLEITVTGKQGHGGMPWDTVDPITTSALVISGLQTVVSRKAKLTDSPVVVTNSPKDGLRVLVERLWPRGLTKQRAAVALWLKDVAPSPALRKWFVHDPARWEQFQERYRRELRGKKEAVEMLKQEAKDGTVTLVYAARDREHNGALALRSFLETN